MTSQQWLYVGAAAIVIAAAAIYLTDDKPAARKTRPAPETPPSRESEPARRKAGRPKGSKTRKSSDGVIVETPPAEPKKEE